MFKNKKNTFKVYCRHVFFSTLKALFFFCTTYFIKLLGHSGSSTHKYKHAFAPKLATKVAIPVNNANI